MATVRIPGSLRQQVGGASALEVDGATVRDVLEKLAADHPGIRDRLLDDGGSLRRFVRRSSRSFMERESRWPERSSISVAR